MIKYFLDPPARADVDLRLERKTDGASGFDLMANIGLDRTIAAGARWHCPTGLYLEMPVGVEGQIRTRSGLSRDHGIVVLNAPGTVDSDYRGEIMVTLLNTDRTREYVVHPGARIAQIVFCPVFGRMSALHGRSYPDTDAVIFGIDQNPSVIKRVSSRGELSLTDRGAAGHGSTGV